MRSHDHAAIDGHARFDEQHPRGSKFQGAYATAFPLALETSTSFRRPAIKPVNGA